MAELVQRMQRETASLALLARELRGRIERGDDETQGIPAADVDGVRLMTIHRAKGLEFPVVILPDLGSDPRGGDNGPLRHLPGDPASPLGLHLRSIDDADRGEWRCDFAAWQAGREHAQRAEAEEKRLLYVAWTRAKRRLVLTAAVDGELKRDRWARQLLTAMGVTAHGQQSPDPRVRLLWRQAIPRAQAQPRTPAIGAVQAALAKGALALPAAPDITLVAPAGEAATPPRWRSEHWCTRRWIGRCARQARKPGCWMRACCPTSAGRGRRWRRCRQQRTSCPSSS
jgi:ATP-dependent exoDNAse (exonuclease V) beta subunit